MIHYQLLCDAGHEFDGWFKDSATFDRQTAGGLLECPTCGSSSVRRALMAPALARRAATPADPAPPASPPAAPAEGAPPASVAVSGPRLPAEARALLQKLRAEIEKNCDYVGADFAAEARRVHDGSSARVRNIYGEATPEEAEALAEDGIGVTRIPWVPLADG
ncbi:MAG: DUF1178 family protein [Acetobacteraceae bacterium]